MPLKTQFSILSKSKQIQNFSWIYTEQKWKCYTFSFGQNGQKLFFLFQFLFFVK